MGIAADYWNKIYSNNPYLLGKDPDPFLEQFISRMQKGKTLDLGMGEGQNATFLASHGFNVKALDISDVAVEHAKSLAREKGVEIQIEKKDLDLFVLGLMEYDSIIMINFKPPIKRYYSEIIRALKQGGTLLVKSYMDAEQEEAFGPEDGYKNYYYYSNELLNNIRDLKILYYNEDKIDGKKVVQCLAQKPMDKDAAKYNLFNMQSDNKEAGMSKQRELAEALFKKKE
ncbi:MAG: class I SAM-dependent methyltransferase [Bdellovibrionales bacterium]|nr:class I SAM-dependent methyltransferase [Bdellovibrionales bacterium]